MERVKISVPLPPAVHQAVKMEAVLRGSSSVTDVLAEIVDARLNRRKLSRPLAIVAPSSAEDINRPSVFLPTTMLERLEHAAHSGGQTVPALIASWVRSHFERSAA